MLEEIKKRLEQSSEIEGEEYKWKCLRNTEIYWLILEVERLYKEIETSNRALHRLFVRNQKYEQLVNILKELLEED